MFNPSIKEVALLAKKYKKIPISKEIPVDTKKPIQIIKKLKQLSQYYFIIENSQNNHQPSRYTFLGYNPLLQLSCTNSVMTLDDFKEKKRKTFELKNPKEFINNLLNDYKSPKILGMPPFTGGLFGYFAYDFIKYSEPCLELDGRDKYRFKDLDLMLFDKVIVFDHKLQKIVIIANMDTADIKTGYQKAKSDIEDIIKIIQNSSSKEENEEPEGKLTSEFKAQFDQKEYCKKVTQCKQFIQEGEAFQIVISNCLQAQFEGSLIGTYQRLKALNPSPYMFYFKLNELEVAGASPETLVNLQDGVVRTFPLAGTRPRKPDFDQDIKMEKELMADQKELAEHDMLVDLGRNDLGKISKFGTVKVESYMKVERFSHVMHIGSVVRGDIDDSYTALDAIQAVLPSGTLSGAPKIRACKIINELEDNKRAIYGGAIGYIDLAGDMDTCIAIRLAYKKDNKVFVRSGCGIVADSDPQKEYEESVSKSKAVITALQNVNGGVCK